MEKSSHIDIRRWSTKNETPGENFLIFMPLGFRIEKAPAQTISRGLDLYELQFFFWVLIHKAFRKQSLNTFWNIDI